jgi:Family of unknown function (DUF6614)
LDIYQGFIDLKPGVRDSQFVEALDAYLGHLKEHGRIQGWRLLRRKLGLGPDDLGEFQLLIEVNDMAQLDAAFMDVSARAEPIEGVHFSVNSLVARARFALYRDFPDPQRKRGQEKF